MIQGSVDRRGIPGWDKVDQLTDLLLTCTSLSLSAEQAMALVIRFNALDDYDKQRVIYPPRHAARQVSGRFKSPKKKSGVVAGVESTSR